MTEREKKWKERVPEETREHYRKARAEMREVVKGFLPEGVLEHHRNARREMLLAWRSMLDHAIKKMGEKA
jgi:hypothetical protein